MSVTPDSAYFAMGVQGGLATPYLMEYTVKNIGEAPLRWSAESTELWANVRPTGGLLDPQDEVVVRMSLDQVVVRGLRPSLQTGSIDFVNLDNDAGTVSRGINLDIRASSEPSLSVSPDDPFDSTGLVGGPFLPSSKVYTLTNESSVPLNWTVQSSGRGLLFDTTAGLLAPGEQLDVTASIDQDAASKLGLGDHYQTFSFGIPGSDFTSVERDLTVHVRPASPGTTSDSLTQFGITWTFDRDYEVGQFVNDDWWVRGPVSIIGISPASDSSDSRRINGAMLNPSPVDGSSQGYDSSAYGQYGSAKSYQDGLNVALDVGPNSPLNLANGSSLVSSASLNAAGLRPQTCSSAILTVVEDAPAPGSFRPAYSALDKSIRFDESQLDYSKLSRLAALPETPQLARVERWFLRPWVDHVPSFLGRYLHPVENMPDYGREIADQIGTATLMLNLDYTDAEKRTLLVRIVQLGIDMHGVFERDGKRAWLPNGGHMSGRKWSILFAGLMLDDPAMSSVGLDPEALFAEDAQTFFVAETSPGVINFGSGGYSATDVGLVDWGVLHAIRPGNDDKNWYGNPYRLCCTANVWWGQVLSAHIMGARDLWKHEPLFEYQDRFQRQNLANGIQDFRLAWTDFPYAMWRAYRANY